MQSLTTEFRQGPVKFLLQVEKPFTNTLSSMFGFLMSELPLLDRQYLGRVFRHPSGCLRANWRKYSSSDEV